MQSTNSEKPQFQNMPPTYKVLEQDPAKVAAFNQRLKEEQNFGLAVIAGGFTALLGSILWAFFAVISRYKIGVIALLVGLAVSFAVRKYGRGIEERFRILAAVYAILGCLLGNVFIVIGIIAQQTGANLFRVFWFLLTHPTALAQPITTISLYDLIFCGLAFYEARRFSLRVITEEEKEALLRERPWT